MNLCNTKKGKEHMAASKWIKCFGLRYTVCFDLSCIDRRGFMFGLFYLQVIQSGFLTMATQISRILFVM